MTVEDSSTFDSGEGQLLAMCAMGTCLSVGDSLIVKKKLRPELYSLQKKIMWESQPPGDCIWRNGLHRGDQVKVRSLGWALIQYNGCPYKGKFALAGVAQWIECQPANPRVAGLIPSQGTRLGCGLGVQ